MMQWLLDSSTRKSLFSLWCVAWLVIAALMLAPVGSPLPYSYADLVIHFLVFACLAFGAVGFCRSGTRLTLLALGTIAGGIVLEFAQGMTGYRTLDILDMGANSLGAMVGYAGAVTVLLLVIRPAMDTRKPDASLDVRGVLDQPSHSTRKHGPSSS